MSNSFSVVLRRDYLELIESMAVGIEGKVIRCAATLITYYRHWQEWKQKHQRTDWVYQPLRQIYRDLMGLFSMPVIRAANDLLSDLGLLERRGNPGNGQDKTYQYNVRFDRVRELLAKSCAGASFEKTDVSVAIPNFSSLTANTHHNIQFNKVISSNHDAIEKNEIESNQKSITSTTQVEIPTATKEQEEAHRLVAESLDVGQHSDTSLDGDEKIELAQQFLASLNTAAQRAERYRSPVSDQIRRVRIPGLDEETHEVLWKHQATLEKLNADLNAERLKSAIADNPQHLEDAILAFKENSAKGAKTKEAATGFLFNALRYGWKPRQSSSASTNVQVYTPPPQILSDPLPPTFEQVVERKRLMWQNASILRPGVEAWVQQTKGVIMTHDGPAIADNANTPSFSEPEQNEPITLNQSSLLVASNHTATVANAPTEPGCHQPPATDNSDEESLSSAAVELPTELSPTTPPSPTVKQASRSKFQPVEILTKAGEWVAGYFVHSCIAVANLVGIERRFTLFDALGQTYVYRGQIRPPQNLAGAT
ncbi:MAG: hypothetical protein KME05_23620 [Gloeocapsa sp. UFS-A4-WI-NPMV-4B04]|nr:hypothetical protein [Gloeocapsa sp. UFS-A4-WI-NPMV-4B04]